jgi:hypothetical protein
VAVQDQWLEAGHVSTSGTYHLQWSQTQEKETRFSELRMPYDGKLFKRELNSGQRIPDSFWQTQRYRISCILPPKSSAAGECVLRMADLAGDSKPEIILDAHTIGTWGEYVKPAVGHRLTIYQASDTDWKMAVKVFRFCPADEGSSDGLLHTPSQKLDMLWVNGHAVNFFDTTCGLQENTVSDTVSELDRARVMAPQLSHIELLPSSKPMPPSLAIALSERTILLPRAGEPTSVEAWSRSAFQGLPPCFTAHDPKACMAVIADIDNDDSDDVVILDHKVRDDGGTWRMATLLMMRQGRWTAVANHAVCAKEGEKLEDVPIEFKDSAWRPIEFAGRLYLPDEPSDNCGQHFAYM